MVKYIHSSLIRGDIMSILELKKDIYWVGVKNPELKVFDVIMTTDRGTTYNSYLIEDEKVAIIDTVKTGYFKSYHKNLEEVLKGKKVDYIIVNHTELDHSGSLRELLGKYPDAVVYGSRPACTYLKKIVNKEFKCHPIGDGEELSLGKRTLKFITAPFLHWPDTIFTYDVTDKVLFTCDAFGSHYCSDQGMFNDNAGDFAEEMKYYFDVIMGPFKKYVLQAMNKVEDLNIDMICTSHGPIHRQNPKQYIGLYREWSKGVLDTHEGKVASIFYVSAYGNTRYVAELLKECIQNSGVKVNIFDITEENINELVKVLEASDAVLLGSPTINQDALKPAWDLLSLVSPIVNRGKVAGAFGSYGWSGEAVGMMIERMKSLKLKVVEPGVRVNFVPSDQEKELVRQYGQRIIEALQ
jgi:Uncharacterized flavoproteins